MKVSKKKKLWQHIPLRYSKLSLTELIEENKARKFFQLVSRAPPALFKRFIGQID